MSHLGYYNNNKEVYYITDDQLRNNYFIDLENKKKSLIYYLNVNKKVRHKHFNRSYVCDSLYSYNKWVIYIHPCLYKYFHFIKVYDSLYWRNYDRSRALKIKYDYVYFRFRIPCRVIIILNASTKVKLNKKEKLYNALYNKI